MPVIPQAPQRYLGLSPYFEKGDYADAFGDYMDDYALAAYELAFLYQMTGDPKYAGKAYQFADAVANLDNWVDTWGKFPWLYRMGKPYGAKGNENEDDEIVFSYTLGSARVAREMAATYDWLYSWMDGYQRKRIRSALLENGILPVRGNYDYHWWANAWRTNWLPGCLTGVGTAALALYPEDPRLMDVVAETRKRLFRYLDELTGMGGSQEGTSYWTSGMAHAVRFAAALKQVSQGKINMFEHNGLKTTLQFPMYTFTPPRGSVPFEDGHEGLPGDWTLFNKLAEELQSPQAKWLAKFFVSYEPSGVLDERDLFSIIWPESSVPPALPDSSRPLSIHFRTIDWVMMRASWEAVDHPVLAAKGGILDDPQHGHLDAGQFAIKYRGEWFVKDLGYMEPNGLGYWDYRRRFNYVHANSLGHNVVFVNGEQQKYGKQFFGKVTDFRTSAAEDYAVIDASHAYPGVELKGWKRHILFKKPDVFIILDEVQSAKGAEIAARIHPGGSYKLGQGYALLTGKEGTMAMLVLGPKGSAIRGDRHPFLPENRDAQFSWIPFYDLVAKAESERTLIANLFLPVEDDAEAQSVLRLSTLSINRDQLECLVTYRGRRLTTLFEISSEGVKLKQ